MRRDRNSEVERICQAAMDLPPAERAAFVNEACGRDTDLRGEVEALLAQATAAGQFLETPALGWAVAGSQQAGNLARSTSPDDSILSSARTIVAGSRIGSFEIRGLIGVGGMGEVYRARDTRLERDVALKVLPDAVASDRSRLARFQREAQLLAALDHPNIATIYGFEEADGIRALVLELVEGPTLADRIDRGPIPLREALAIARQIVDALDAAHQKGIIHRDLKPTNIKVRPDGATKVLDFGLAKMLDRAPETSDSTPTRMLESMPGLVLGTAAYMSPEQARGQPVDRRTDVWAFGCVLFEMLTGVAAFDGNTSGDIVAAVLHTEPAWHRLPASTPDAIRRALHRCLHKDGRLRLHDVADVRLELDDAPAPESAVVRPSHPSLPRQVPLWTATALAIVTAIAAITWAHRPVHAVAEPREMRLTIPTAPTTDPVSLAVSPNGEQVAFVATADGRPRLWLRSLHEITARPLPGTDFAAYPFWSPDSRSIGFFANQKLIRVDIAGGAVQSLTRVEVGLGGTWTQDGAILFSARPASAILRIGENGGEVTPVTRVQAPEVGHRFPHILPDGRHFMYFVAGSSDAHGVYLGDTRGSDTRKLVAADSPATYLLPGYLLFVRQTTLYAQRFDPAALTVSGPLLAVAEHVVVDQAFGCPGVSTATNSDMVLYREIGGGVTKNYVWFNRTGEAVARFAESANIDLGHASLAPDGHRVAMALAAGGNSDLWVLDTTRGTSERFTTDPGNDIFPVWSPDGSQIVFGSNRRGRGAPELYVKSTNTSGPEELLTSALSGHTAIPDDWSPDGRFVVFRDISPKGGYDLWALPVRPVGTPFPIVQTPFEEFGAQFSPNGKWIAYQSDESGTSEVYVQPFPGPGRRTQISPSGGSQVRWNRNGRELFYVAQDGRLMSVRIDAAPDGTTLDVGVPIPLFATRMVGALPGQGNHRQQYMVAPDGERFLVHSVVAEDTSPIIVVLNWKPGS
jgi:serine/threonine protein kinase/Tol biopolymer transport system component